ncbi:RluA family pseudouridine synthase [Alicycliphilus sp. B1]|nr:RluA family pseudouridine synthase [Alicycliphilus sp. B1]
MSKQVAGDGLPWPDEESDPQRTAEEESDAELREVMVPAAQHQARLDKALAELVPEFSRSYLQQLLAQGDVRLNGQPAAKPAHKVRAGGPGGGADAPHAAEPGLQAREPAAGRGP